MRPTGIKRDDDAFIDELDISGRTSETRSKDRLSLRVVLSGPSLVSPPSEMKSAALTKAGLPTFLDLQKGKVALEVRFSKDPEAPPVSAEVEQNQVKDPSDVCEMLDHASGDKHGSDHHGGDDLH